MASNKVAVATKLVNNKVVTTPANTYEKTVVYNGKIYPESQIVEEGISSSITGGGHK